MAIKEVMVARSFVILSWKKLGKVEGRSEDGMVEGDLGSDERLSKLLRVDQSFRGCLAELDIS